MSPFCEYSGQDSGLKSLLSMVYKSMVDLNSIHRAVNVTCLAMCQGEVTTGFKMSKHVRSMSHKMLSLRRVNPIKHWRMWGRKGSRFCYLIPLTLHPALYHSPMIQPSPTPPSMTVPDNQPSKPIIPIELCQSSRDTQQSKMGAQLMEYNQ